MNQTADHEMEEFRTKATEAAWIDSGRFAHRFNRSDCIVNQEHFAMMLILRGLLIACPKKFAGAERESFMRGSISKLGVTAFPVVYVMKSFGFEPDQFTGFLARLDELDRW